MKKILCKIFTVTAAMLLLSACAKSPTEKLRSSELYADLNPAFWAKEHEAKTPLWEEGTTYCQDHSEKPNCAALMQVFMISNGATEMPAYGTSGHPLKTPDF